MFYPYEKEISTIINIFKEAIPLSLNIEEKLSKDEIKEKADGTVVSVADFAIQALIMNGINKNLPGDDVLGEEDIKKTTPEFLEMVKSVLPTDLDPISACSKQIHTINHDNHRTWVIDPIDGTLGFIDHIAYAISTCLLVDLKPKVSVAAWPLHNPKYTGIQMEGPVIFIAIDGGKSYAMDMKGNIKEMPVLTKGRLATCAFTIKRVQSYLLEKLEIPDVVKLPSMVKGFVLGAGQACVYLITRNKLETVWDIAPWEMFVRNCGGIVTTGKGVSLEYLSNGFVKDSDLGIVCTMGGKEWHEKVLKVYQDRMIELYNTKF